MEKVDVTSKKQFLRPRCEIAVKKSNLCAQTYNSKIFLTLFTKRLPVCKFLQKILFWAVWKMFRKVCMDYEVDFEA